ncbi:MAG: hypothetical protein Q4F84_06240, partial [Fibrobacter sp.]|nr:hypothetical protein [Fibrobacter sp.]
QSMEEYNHSFSAENVLIAHNRAYGVNTVSARLHLNKVTISDNGMGGIRLEVPNKPSVITNSLITDNNAFGVLHESSEYGNGPLDTKTTNFFKNAEAIMADSFYIKQNLPILTADPYYVDKDNNDYRIGEQSVLYGTEIGYKNYSE